MNIYTSKASYIINPYILGKDKIEGNISFNNNINNRTGENLLVRLFMQKTGALLLSVSSNKNAEYCINDIDLKKGPYFLVAHDPKKEYNGVIADNIGGNNVDD